MNLLGIRQGRLSAASAGRLQGLPWGAWEQELDKARALGLDAVEWVFGADRAAENPIRSSEGRMRMRQCSTQSRVRVASVYADYFLTNPLMRVASAEQAKQVQVLMELIAQARAVGAVMVVLPLVKQAAPQTQQDQADLAACLREPLALARSLEMNLALETGLSAPDSFSLLSVINHESARVSYDAAAEATKGCDAASDIRQLGKHLGVIRIEHSPEGAADFTGIFEALADTSYAGPLMLQFADGKDVAASIAFVRQYLPLKQASRIGVAA